MLSLGVATYDGPWLDGSGVLSHEVVGVGDGDTLG